MPDFPLIEMGVEYRETETGRPGRVLAVDGKWSGRPVVWERGCGSLLRLTRDGKECGGDSKPFIERVPKRHTVRVYVCRTVLGELIVTSDHAAFEAWRQVAVLTLDFVEGQGL